MIYGDHNAMTISDKDNIEKTIKKDLNKDYQWQDYQKVPLIMRLSDTKMKGINHNSVGEVDVMPTVFDLYDINGIKHFGSSVLDNKNHLVVLRDGSYVYGRNFYDKKNNTTYNLDSGKILSNDLKKINEAKNQLNASDYIIRYNYLKNK
ncbi:phosphoglycerol transferase MdoB-like AlkP superfamily enzyme [Clostridium algifaecis]|uniref:Phosphoglycerol transferase MdoB-like AlkP superfamily enzyme n=2 Tax=Clostridium algifaecis TaxID=1472040 RepID=A0ABS4KQ93_9CLOT|nr:phosphoglycerol transferase MdoB-like AlkP superfamily enzyme [Clostridium algifaecis]